MVVVVVVVLGVVRDRGEIPPRTAIEYRRRRRSRRRRGLRVWSSTSRRRRREALHRCALGKSLALRKGVNSLPRLSRVVCRRSTTASGRECERERERESVYVGEINM